MSNLVAILNSPQAASEILMVLAQLSIMAGGFSLIFSRLRRFAVRLLILGVFFVGAGAFLPEFLAELRVSAFGSQDWIVVWLAIAGTSALILGATSVGLLCILPGAIQFVAIPIFRPELPNIPPAVSQGLVIFAILLGAILALKIVVQAIYGKQTAGHVAGIYLVRTFDAVGRGFGAVAGLPLRFWRRSRGE